MSAAPPPARARPPAARPGSLWFTESELAALRARSRSGSSGRIRRALVRSARAWVAVPARQEGIPPVADDPDFVNLYDRFNAIMSDAAILEQLAFAARLTGARDLRRAAAGRLVALAGAWGPEADRAPEYGSVYATSRLLRSAALALDLAGPFLAPAEHAAGARFAMHLAGTLWDGWFSRPVSAGPASHTHHAHLEWGAFGLAALVLADHAETGRTWVDAAIAKFDRDLLPHGLAEDGAQVEGGSFWASTMLARLAFLDALERRTGLDLFTPHAGRMLPDPALAAIAGPRPLRRGTSATAPQHESRELLLEPGYAQLAYHAPVLLGLARRTRRPLLRRLALRDPRLGALHEPDTATPSGERLRFALGPFALLWDDPGLDAAPDPDPPGPRAWWFRSTGTAHLRTGWEAGTTVVAVDAGGRVTVHASGRVVLAELDPERVLDRAASEAAGTGVWRWEPADRALAVRAVTAPVPGAPGTPGTIAATGPAARAGAHLEVRLDPDGSAVVSRQGGGEIRAWTAPGARRSPTGWAWRGPGGPAVEVVRGTLAALDPLGHADDRRLGYGRLRAVRVHDDRRPLLTLRPDGAGILELRVLPARPPGERRRR